LKNTKIVALEDIALTSALEQAEEFVDEPQKEERGWIRAVSWIWN
jgi:hypothetical protein